MLDMLINYMFRIMYLYSIVMHYLISNIMLGNKVLYFKIS